ncbi:MAG: DUF5696 domain-containing protein, partial [Defluviitaleaceae bacterium]|nr:DUF5696 domain-containing protein [Defluviitaleaceae bacterium]
MGLIGRTCKKIVCAALAAIIGLCGCASHAPAMPDVALKRAGASAAAVPSFTEGPAFPTQVGIKDDTNPNLIIEYAEIARNPWLVMYADMRTGLFAIKNIESDKIWYSTPNDSLLDETTRGVGRVNFQSQIIVSYIYQKDDNTTMQPQTSNSQSACVNNGNVLVERIKDGIRVTYYFEQLGFRIPVEYSIVDDYLNASVDVKNLDEGDEVYLINVILLPTFGAGNLTEEGYVFVPDGCGAIIPFNMNNRLNSP